MRREGPNFQKGGSGATFIKGLKMATFEVKSARRAEFFLILRKNELNFFRGVDRQKNFRGVNLDFWI